MPVRPKAGSSTSSAAVYYDNSGSGGGGGCFGETSTVEVGNQRVKTSVKDVRKGDKIAVADGFATVRCVVKITRSASKSLLAFPGGLTITKRHPIRVNGAWIQPSEIVTTEVSNPSGFVYNFVLDRSHVLLVNGIECVTWGHGLNAEGVKHAYYGSKIVEDLSTMQGWSAGFIVKGLTSATKRSAVLP